MGGEGARERGVGAREGSCVAMASAWEGDLWVDMEAQERLEVAFLSYTPVCNIWY